MAKWYGAIGYVETVETSPGVWKEQITKRNYYGELVRNTSKFQTADQLNDNVNIANEVSIVSDPYANQHFYEMRYIEFWGAKWKITNVEVKYPRLILTIGGLYNSEQTGSAD